MAFITVTPEQAQKIASAFRQNHIMAALAELPEDAHGERLELERELAQIIGVTTERIVAGAVFVPATFTRISAKEQRSLFGAVPFGRRLVRHIPGRGFEVRRIVAYGQDWDDQRWSYKDIAKLVARGNSVVGKKD